MKLKPKKWEEFQHYKNRNPPWIKLQKTLLDDYEFQGLHVASRALAPMLWLLASESTDGVFDANIDRLAFRLRTDKKELADALKELINKGFFVVASGALAERLRDAMPETETETETEKPLSGKPGVFSFKTELLKLGADPVLVGDWLQVRVAKKARNTKTALDGFIREVKKSGFTYDQALRRCCEKNWSGFEAEWVANVKPPTDAVAVVPFDRAAYEADKKAALARMREEEAKYIVPPVGLRA